MDDDDYYANALRRGSLKLQPGSSSAADLDDDDAGRQLVVGDHTKQGPGRYRFPSVGLMFLWKRNGSVFTGLTIRDVNANQDICETSFCREITAASTARGRRQSIALPHEDLVLLKAECSGNFSMTVIGGTILNNSCLPSPCELSDIERILSMSCPWEDGKSHRLELVTTAINTKKSSRNIEKQQGVVSKGSRSSSYGMVSATGVRRTGDTKSEQSEFDIALETIRATLVQLGLEDSQAMSHLSNLISWLKIVKGTRSRGHGGREYLPSYMLDSVMLSDRLKILEDMGDAMKESLVFLVNMYVFL